MNQEPVLIKGKLPPQAVDIEEAILGALIISEKAMFEIANFMFAEAFYKEPHRIIYSTISDMFIENETIDLLTISNRLRKDKKLKAVGGDKYLIDLSQAVSSSAHIENHCRIVLQKFIARQLIVMHNNGIKMAYDDGVDVFDLLDRSYNLLAEVTEKTIKPTDVDLEQVVYQEIHQAKNVFNKVTKPGIQTHLEKLNDVLGGLRESEFLILAARPSMGKTALAVNIATFSALNGIPAAIYSLEMSKGRLIRRIISDVASLPGNVFTKYGLSPEAEDKFKDHRGTIKKITKNLHIDDFPSLSIELFQVKARIAHRKYGIKMIIVDYLQLMSSQSGNSRGNREQEISRISRGLKATAMALNIPVIALSQLSRAVETRGGTKRPLLSDLRESGSLEQDADVVGFLYRPEYYKIEEWDDESRSPTHGQAEIIIAKNRNGGIDDVRVKFEGQYSRFSDIDDFDFPKPKTLNENSDVVKHQINFDDLHNPDNDQIPF